MAYLELDCTSGFCHTRTEAHDHFKRTLAKSRWDKIRGYHVFRHSFTEDDCSHCQHDPGPFHCDVGSRAERSNSSVPL